jgi:acetoin utilization deacetylase AcuC-like enzyme
VPFVEGTWEAIQASCDVALTGRKALSAGGERAVFSICRPPGHHAGPSLAGGYCYVNNVAVAAQACRDDGAAKVAILDVDYHHGNGTQAIFYDRDDVLFVSLHGHPDQEYPYFAGYAEETGSGAGEGFNVNDPMPWGTGWGDYAQALERGIAKVRDYKPDVLLVSLGVDTYKEDPISYFKLDCDDYLVMGEMIAGLDLPTLFVMEGGYAVEEIGVNVVNTLTGFENA